MSKFISAGEYAARRASLLAALPAGAVAVIASQPEALRNGDDNGFAYRASSDILYLTGFAEPNCMLVFDKTVAKSAGRLLMFVQPSEPSAEIWHGKRCGIDGVKQLFGADAAYGTKSFAKVLGPLTKRARSIFYKRGINLKVDAIMLPFCKNRRLKNPLDLVAAMRLIKSPGELQIMRHSGKVGSLSHKLAMRHCVAGASELALRGVLDLVNATNGGVNSYDTIVAAGANGLCLHYSAGQTILRDGELVLIDAGSEIEGYASDISRTFPVSGSFSQAQKKIYEVVLAGQLAAIAAIKPGITWNQLSDACDAELTEGLVRLGFDISASGLKLGDVMPHSLGHWLGLDVHDVGAFSGKMPFQAGMVLTIEPGVYLSLTDERIPEQYRGICVRIEDNIEVTADGAFVQTADAPKAVADIEHLMAASGVRQAAQYSLSKLTVPVGK